MSERVGEQFGDYRLARKLGGGTFGDVYLGQHTSNNTPAAVKILQARLTNSEDLKDYINEIRSLFRLQHPNIVPLLDFGIERDTPFLIMAYAPNGTLRLPRGTRLPLGTVVSYIRQIAEALQHAHDLKLIHRDVKPDNILSGLNRQIWLSDFGIVSIAQSSRSLNTEDSAGTIHYMAPEQILGKPRFASDQYALGITAYEWICGLRPFNGTSIEVAMQHSQAQPPSLREQMPTLSPVVEQVVLKALAKDPKDRFDSVREFAEALATSVGQSGPLPATQKAKAQWTETVVMPMAQKTKEQWFDEGNAYYGTGKYKEAIGAYNHAILLDGRYIDAYINRGATYDDLQEYAKAIDDYNHVIDLNPMDADAYYNRGNTYRDLKEYNRAIADYNRAIELNPRYADAYYKRGNVYLNLKQYPRAIADFNRAIELNPNDIDAFSRRGLALYALKDYQHAIQDFDYALRLDPSIIARFRPQREDAYRKLGRKP